MATLRMPFLLALLLISQQVFLRLSLLQMLLCLLGKSSWMATKWRLLIFSSMLVGSAASVWLATHALMSSIVFSMLSSGMSVFFSGFGIDIKEIFEREVKGKGSVEVVTEVSMDGVVAVNDADTATHVTVNLVGVFARKHGVGREAVHCWEF